MKDDVSRRVTTPNDDVVDCNIFGAQKESSIQPVVNLATSSQNDQRLISVVPFLSPEKYVSPSTKATASSSTFTSRLRQIRERRAAQRKSPSPSALSPTHSASSLPQYSAPLPEQCEAAPSHVLSVSPATSLAISDPSVSVDHPEHNTLPMQSSVEVKTMASNMDSSSICMQKGHISADNASDSVHDTVMESSGSSTPPSPPSLPSIPPPPPTLLPEISSTLAVKHPFHDTSTSLDHSTHPPYYMREEEKSASIPSVSVNEVRVESSMLHQKTPEIEEVADSVESRPLDFHRSSESLSNSSGTPPDIPELPPPTIPTDDIDGPLLPQVSVTTTSPFFDSPPVLPDIMETNSVTESSTPSISSGTSTPKRSGAFQLHSPNRHQVGQYRPERRSAFDAMLISETSAEKDGKRRLSVAERRALTLHASRRPDGDSNPVMKRWSHAENLVSAVSQDEDRSKSALSMFETTLRSLKTEGSQSNGQNRRSMPVGMEVYQHNAVDRPEHVTTHSSNTNIPRFTRRRWRKQPRVSDDSPDDSGSNIPLTTQSSRSQESLDAVSCTSSHTTEMTEEEQHGSKSRESVVSPLLAASHSANEIVSRPSASQLEAYKMNEGKESNVLSTIGADDRGTQEDETHNKVNGMEEVTEKVREFTSNMPLSHVADYYVSFHSSIVHINNNTYTTEYCCVSVLFSLYFNTGYIWTPSYPRTRDGWSTQ